VGKGAPNPTLSFILISRAVPTSVGRPRGQNRDQFRSCCSAC